MMTPTPDPDDEILFPQAPYQVHVPPELEVQRDPFWLKGPKTVTAPVERPAPPATHPDGLAPGLKPAATVAVATPAAAAYAARTGRAGKSQM